MTNSRVWVMVDFILGAANGFLYAITNNKLSLIAMGVCFVAGLFVILLSTD